MEYLHARGIFVWRQNTGGVYDPRKGIFRRNHSINGVSDILGILPDGRFLAVECKSKTGRVRKEQDEFLDEIARRGGFATVVRAVDELEADLKEFGF